MRTQTTKPLGYLEWRSQAMAQLAVPNLMLERHWRRMFILGRRSGEAVEEAEALVHNARVRKLGRRR